ncbi:MAG: sulfatase-like hydrolase/transferase [Planctomycetes bacterium]|nr:sulfatase-like hydrolase/transferase [Planctomycetota bacterium]
MVNKPNIIMIVSDSWDGRMLGCLGHPALEKATPVMDSLAAEGALFTEAYSSHPICCPARANLWSGCYTHNCESWNNYQGLPKGSRTFMTRLREEGYVFGSGEGGFGKHDYTTGSHTHLARVSAWIGASGIDRPVYDNCGCQKPRIREDRDYRDHKGDWDQVDRAVEFMEANAGGEQPFFLYLGLNQPHPPFHTNRYWLEQIPEDKIDIPPHDPTDHPVVKFQQRSKTWQPGFEEDSVREIRRIYFAMCAEVDAMIGTVRAKMKELGLGENTYFVVTSDHGELALEHQQYYKTSMYEGSVRIPMSICGPGIEGGRRINNTVSLIDVTPTLLEMAGVEPEAHYDGESLLPLAKGETEESRNTAYACHTGSSINTTMYMLRKGEYKYVAYKNHPPQLFNLLADPDELNNLAGKEQGIAAEMDKELRKIVDYDDAHERCMVHNKHHFREWRRLAKLGLMQDGSYGLKDAPSSDYMTIMNNIYTGFNEEDEKLVDEWLAGR